MSRYSNFAQSSTLNDDNLVLGRDNLVRALHPLIAIEDQSLQPSNLISGKYS